jgi:hypothetical protein
MKLSSREESTFSGSIHHTATPPRGRGNLLKRSADPEVDLNGCGGAVVAPSASSGNLLELPRSIRTVVRDDCIILKAHKALHLGL